MKIFFIFLAFLIVDCSDSDDIISQETEKQTLDTLRKEITDMADESTCSEKFTCDFVGFGSKPCGGFWEYLVYSNSIDVTEFLAKVETYNKIEKEYNIKHGIFSDCMAVTPPTDVICENSKCKAVYN